MVHNNFILNRQRKKSQGQPAHLHFWTDGKMARGDSQGVATSCHLRTYLSLFLPFNSASQDEFWILMWEEIKTEAAEGLRGAAGGWKKAAGQVRALRALRPQQVFGGDDVWLDKGSPGKSFPPFPWTEEQVKICRVVMTPCVLFFFHFLRAGDTVRGSHDQPTFVEAQFKVSPWGLMIWFIQS